MQMSGGWTGRMLDLNLTTKEATVVDSGYLTDRFMGGVGLGQALILEEIPVGCGALDPENVVVLSAGPLVGTAAPSSCRLSISTKNAVTGGVNFSSAGGHFAPELKYAGYDAVVVRGRAEHPEYVEIVDGIVRFRDARNLWGKSTGETEDTIRQEMGDKHARVLCIGPAGENQTMAGCVIVDRFRAGGRGAVGSVLGSKNLKALAVRGTRPVHVTRPEAFMKEVVRADSRLEHSEATRMFREYGLFMLNPLLNEQCHVPFRNAQDEHVDPARLESVHPQIFVDHYRERKISCFNCRIVCDNRFTVREGLYAGAACQAFEQNSVENFADRLDINDPGAVLYLCSLCAALGLDIDNSSVAVAWAFECFERGLLNVEQCDGLELRWGDHRVVAQVLEKLARREGLGALLALGVKEAARRTGPASERLALHVKGQELQESLRAHKGWALGVVVATRGGAHLDGAPTTETWENASVGLLKARFGNTRVCDPTTMEGKPEAVFYYEGFKAAADALGLCWFACSWVTPDHLWPEHLAALLSASTGRDYTAEELLAVGRQIVEIRKAFNTLHMGFARQDDLPPLRLQEEPILSGPRQGARLDMDEWHQALDRYYSLHGWDVATGWQTREGLAAVGLPEVAERLAGAGRLPE